MTEGRGPDAGNGFATRISSAIDALGNLLVLPLDPDNKLLPQCCEILFAVPIKTPTASDALMPVVKLQELV